MCRAPTTSPGYIATVSEPVPISRFSSLVRHALAAAVFMAGGVVLLMVELLLLPSRALRIRSGNLYGKIIGPMVFRIAGIAIEVEGRDKINASAPAIYLANHSSNVDPWASMWLCPMGGCGVAKKSVGRIPVFGQVYWLAGHLLIDRASPQKAIQSVNALSTLVQRLGLSIWLWPEGTQSRDGRLLPFKRGFVHMAIATGLPVVPVVFHDAHKRWPARSTTLVPGTLRVQVLDPISTSDWTTASSKEHAREVAAVFARHLATHQRPLQEEPPSDVRSP